MLALFAFFALPGIGIRFSNVVTFAAVLAIYAGAYLTESFRAAILVIPRGISEAGDVDRPDAHRHRDLGDPADRAPQRAAGVGNNFISLFKDTSIAAVIAVPELTFQARKINNESFRIIEVWLVASLIYVATCALIAAGLRGLERLFPKF